MSTPTIRTPANLLETLAASLESALRSPEGVADPVALLWTDADGQWRPLLPQLLSTFPQLYTLGSYDPATRTGPVIWLKCIVDRTLSDVSPAEGLVPILYLPGVDRQQLRAAAECPDPLKPLVELQYRGAVWHQRNGKDWTVEAFLVSEYGLGLDVAQDTATREAMLRSLTLLGTEPLTSLRGLRLEAENFDRLSISDPVRDLLSWMSDPSGFQSRSDPARWQTFQTVCMREYDFDPEQAGPEAAGDALLHGGGKWDVVWQRFCESPRVYRGLTTLLRRPAKTLFVAPERRPTVNSSKEDALRRELDAVTGLPHHEACERVLSLEVEHQERRDWVWAALGESALAVALEPLARLARLARSPLGGATAEAVVQAYVADGWQCDRAAVESLSSVSSPADSALVARVVRALYEPWLDKSARHFQSLAGAEGADLRKLAKPHEASEQPSMVQESEAAFDSGKVVTVGDVPAKDTCVLFADGLRFDVAATLHERLEARGLRVRLTHRIAPLPTVTATGKPLASPLRALCRGEANAEEFTPVVAASGQPATAPRLREQLAGEGIAVLATEDSQPPAGRKSGGWSEIGQLDGLGHSLGIRLARQIEAEVETIADRVVGLIEAGWSRVKVVTDHGWLLLPGGLPKVDLPHFLVATRWSRCATVKGQATTSVPTFGWHWNPLVRIASPPGIGSFVASAEYAHGGISVQECVVPELIVQQGAERVRAEIKSWQWQRMRCRVAVETNANDLRVDIRLNSRQPGSSIVAAVKEIGAGGDASLAVSDDSHEGAAATIVVLDRNGQVLDHKPTTVGE